MIVTCEGCDTPFETHDVRKRRCRKNCGRTSSTANQARDAARTRHTVTFAGVDGEGVTRDDGRHEYVMLAVSDAVLTDAGYELGPYQILEHLWEHRDAADALTGYYLGYDFTHWIKNLPEPVARELITVEGQRSRQRVRSGGNPIPFPVRWEGWEFDLLADRRFKLRPAGAKSWAYVCDAGPFWQTGFLTAIDPAGWPDGGVCTDQQFALIAQGKARRAVAQLDADMLAYNAAENAVMAGLMSRLNEGLVAMGIRLDRDQWYGPGQAAGEWLAATGAPDSAATLAAVPREVLEAARASFYGGWFEIFAHGHVGDLHEYDLNSAYPKAISGLPCILHGRWKTGISTLSGWALVHAEVSGSCEVMGAMLHREPDGKIHRPRRTRGWFWTHELRAARAAGLIDGIEIESSWRYEPCDCPPPLAAIADLYAHRLRVGKESVSGKAAKLIYNSAYGKLAQSIGSPRWANPLYASLITSLTRTRILEAVALAGPGNVAMIATDGIYTWSEIPGLDVDPGRLGAWSHSIKRNACLHMPGVYWDDRGRERLAGGGSVKLASRGVSARDLAKGIDQLDDLWSRFDGTGTWPTVTVPLDFSMITGRQALARGKWELAGTVRTDDTKTLSGDPVSKRGAGYPRSTCYETGGVLDSAPYDGRLGLPADAITPDGPATMIINGMLR